MGFHCGVPSVICYAAVAASFPNCQNNDLCPNSPLLIAYCYKLVISGEGNIAAAWEHCFKTAA